MRFKRFEPAQITFQDRLRNGFLTINEVSNLAQQGDALTRGDIESGRLQARRWGRKIRIWGDDAVAYLRLLGLPDPTEQDATEAGQDEGSAGAAPTIGGRSIFAATHCESAANAA